MANAYEQLKHEHQRRFDEAMKGNSFYAFNQEQFDEGLSKLGCKASDMYSWGYGTFVLKTASDSIYKILKDCEEEMLQKMKADTTGDGFMYEAFVYELGNHEYVITYEYDDTLADLGITMEQVKLNPAWKRALVNATRYVEREYEEFQNRQANA